MSNRSIDENDTPDDPSAVSPTDASKPIGDAIPTPVEPGLDQPLPEKGEASGKSDQPKDGQPKGKSEDESVPDDNPIGETDPPKGVPAPGPSDFALRAAEGPIDPPARR